MQDEKHASAPKAPRCCSRCGTIRTLRWTIDRFSPRDSWCYACYRRWVRSRPRCERCHMRTPRRYVVALAGDCLRLCHRCAGTHRHTRCTRCTADVPTLHQSALSPDERWCFACMQAYARVYAMEAAEFATCGVIF